jgi:glycerol-3-phosphate acyltransferase PlsX
MKIGIDIMGGDFAPEKTIQGAILSIKDLSSETELFFFGKEEQILTSLKDLDFHHPSIKIINCTDVIEMGDHPTKAFKKKSNSSIRKGFEYLSQGKIDGFASAGNTGAMFVGGYYSVKAISGVIRPCISVMMPKKDGGWTVLLDVGANADCKPDVLYQFGILGSLFSKNICNVENPRVSLLNVGEEKSKGNMLAQSAYSLMEESTDFNFIGNIESRDIFSSKTDVIICDGFTGNIVLKQAEAFYNIIKNKNINDEFFNRLNYENYGGTPILGLNKNVVIGHGISNEVAIKNMILLTEDLAKSNLIKEIYNTLN